MTTLLRGRLVSFEALLVVILIGGVCRFPYRLLPHHLQDGVAVQFLMFLVIFLIPCLWLGDLAIRGAHPLVHQILGLLLGAAAGLLATFWLFQVQGDLSTVLAIPDRMGFQTFFSYLAMITVAVGGWLFGWLTSAVTVLSSQYVHHSRQVV